MIEFPETPANLVAMWSPPSYEELNITPMQNFVKTYRSLLTFSVCRSFAWTVARFNGEIPFVTELESLGGEDRPALSLSQHIFDRLVAVRNADRRTS